MSTGIHYLYPWLLLILIPAFALAFIPYFRLSPKYRRTRNRITSMVLFLVIAFLAVNTLAGITFVYKVPNKENEIILLVDVSDTEEQAAARRDDFVETVLREGRYDNYKVGVVTFGYGQKYAVPLTDDVSGIYDRYIDSLSDPPDTTATDIASAITYAKTLFNYPETGKIVLVTDGKETDGKAASVARSVSAAGIRIDIANIPSEYEGMDVQITGVDLPDYHVNVNEECYFKVHVQSRGEGFPARITFTDNDGALATQTVVSDVTLISGPQSFDISYKFTETGLHKLGFTIDIGNEGLTENNSYVSFMSIEKFNKVLIFERKEGESDALKSILTKDEAFEVDIVNFIEAENIPDTVDELRAYDQVIMNNVSATDMMSRWGDEDKSKDFQLALYSYVYDYGGSVLTVGGDTDDNKPNLYDRRAMLGTTYQQMLPVQAINYTPPLGVVVIIDRSGSMGMTVGASGKDRLWWAKQGAVSCLSPEVMSERDYMGIMTLDSYNEIILPLTPRPQEAKILAAIDSIEEADGGTIATDALNSARQQLLAQKMIDKRHIIVVTDGDFADLDTAIEAAQTNYANGITMSIVKIGESDTGTTMSLRLAAAGNGGDPDGNLTPYEKYVYRDDNQIVLNMREDLNVPEIKDVIYEDFKPIIYSTTSNLVQGLGELDTETNSYVIPVDVGGFYGTKVRKESELILTGNYEVPLYAQWKFGKGMVGSFMIDIGGKWGSQFAADPNGQAFIVNAVGNLMPTENIRPKALILDLRKENYMNHLNVYTELNDGDKVVGKIIDVTDSAETEVQLVTPEEIDYTKGFYVVSGLTEANAYSRCSFVIKKSGVYKIVVTKISADGEEETVEKYTSFSYSEEYNAFSEKTDEDLIETMKVIVSRGNGSLIEDNEDPYEVFKDFVTELIRTFDPRILFMILVIILFLLDIIVRKFKFKWPHEIIRQIIEKRKQS